MDPQPQPFRIATADARIKVIGTRSQLATSAGKTLLSVSHGCVAMSVKNRLNESRRSLNRKLSKSCPKRA